MIYKLRTHKFIIFTAVLTLLCCMPACEKKPAYGFWNTGNAALDLALARADTIENGADYDRDSAYSAYVRIAALSDTADESPLISAVAYYATGALAQFDNDDDAAGEAIALRYDSIALGIAGRAQAGNYIQRRMELELARGSKDVRARTESLYALLPYFTAINDSITVVDALFELNNSFGETWNPATQKDCFTEIIRWTPEFIAPLRDVMQYNIVALERGTAPEKEYIHTLDSLSGCAALLNQSLPMAVMVFSDRYRLRGNAADLDSAAVYAGRMTAYHDALKTYWAQQLYHALKTGNRAKADKFASEIKARAADSSLMEIETLPALIAYYKSRGDSTGCHEAGQLYKLLKMSADAHEESTALAEMEADRKVSLITERSATASKKWIWGSWIAVILLIAVSGYLYVTIRRRKHDEAQLMALHSKLDSSRRRLVVAEMKNSDTAAAEQSGADSHEWERFEAVFTEMHPGFADNLRRDFPNLTRNDIRLCAFISMDMDTKHISSMLSIQPDSVKKQMRRLRTKLGLEPGAPLRDFLSRY